MAKDLIVVESPAKAKTINKYLGDRYVVKASLGHVRDLPRKRLAVDIENGFIPEYEVIKDKSKVITELKKLAKSAEKIYLAPDPDREGEAIAWHVAEEIKAPGDKIFRVLFNEITKRGVTEAMKSPGKIDMNKVDAQQARRVLDRLVGYQVSPLLGKKVKWGASAGRVQSVALRLVVEREREIQAFTPKEYWSIAAALSADSPPPFIAKILKSDGKKFEILTSAQAEEITAYLKEQAFIVSKVDKKEKKQYPVPPFTTSKLQQEAARKLRFSAKKTMLVAQQLYEGLEIGPEGAVGLITYMRTDSVRVSREAVDEARALITDKYGKNYLPEKPPVYASQKKAQEAHEAIRPTSVGREPDAVKDYLDRDQLALYRLIWNRFLASQMNPAILDMTGVDIQAGRYGFKANGSVVKFPGFRALYMEGRDEEKADKETEEGAESETSVNLPPLRVGDLLKLNELTPRQHFTQPPPKYTEASLVKELEEKGIGRPSTYATIMSTIVDREYVEKKSNAFSPTELGFIVTDLLVESFPDLFNVEFTAKMEDELDEIEEGRMQWVDTVREFYDPFEKSLISAQKGMRNVKREETPTDIECEKCGRKMVIKWGRNGRFLACPGYPECKNTRPLPGEGGEGENAGTQAKEPEATGEKCPKCGSPMVIKSGRFGKFMACSAYPQCKTTRPIPLGVSCPKCGGDLSERRTKGGKPFYGCSNYPKCDFASWDRPVPKECPECKSPYLVEKYSKKDGPYIACPNKDCGYKEEPAGEKTAAGEAGGK